MTTREVGQRRAVRTVEVAAKAKLLTHPPRHAATPIHPRRKGSLEREQASQPPPKRKPPSAYEPRPSRRHKTHNRKKTLLFSLTVMPQFLILILF
jgi:hypothetical protein